MSFHKYNNMIKFYKVYEMMATCVLSKNLFKTGAAAKKFNICKRRNLNITNDKNRYNSFNTTFWYFDNANYINHA